MEEYGKILLFAMPAFLIFVLAEKLYGVWKGRDYMPFDDAISSLSSGMSNVVKDVLGLTINIISYAWLVENIAIIHIKETVVLYAIAFLVIDFYGYWSHRFDHKINFFWNEHVVHHSSEEFNLACALRQPVSGILKVFNFLLIPAALVGVPVEIISIVLPLHLFLQFWYHTRHIGKLGFLEYIIVTPSHHRVHHAMNKEYMDKNLGQIFIFWDKIFGTFQEELDDVPPVYGITRPAKTWNPFIINFQHLFLIVKDAWRAPRLVDKLRIWFMPTGWRPEGFEEKYPVEKIDQVYSFKKYKTELPKPLFIWCIVQLFVTLAFISHLFSSIAAIKIPGVFIYGFYILFTIYCFTDLMDRNRWNWILELIRLAFVIGFFSVTGSWFELGNAIAALVIVYQIVSLLFSFKYSQQAGEVVYTN
jgi:sterol desaturase/sphingolipid hydroxylase (fatty acid hydroxylase superfamily)